MPSPKLILNIDPKLKATMQEVATAYGYGSVSGYVRNVIIEDIRKKQQSSTSPITAMMKKIQNSPDSDDEESMALALEGQSWARRVK